MAGVQFVFFEHVRLLYARQYAVLQEDSAACWYVIPAPWYRALRMRQVLCTLMSLPACTMPMVEEIDDPIRNGWRCYTCSELALSLHVTCGRLIKRLALRVCFNVTVWRTLASDLRARITQHAHDHT